MKKTKSVPDKAPSPEKFEKAPEALWAAPEAALEVSPVPDTPPKDGPSVAVSEPTTLKTLEGRLAAVEALLVEMVAGLIVAGQLGPNPNPEKLNGAAREAQSAS